MPKKMHSHEIPLLQFTWSKLTILVFKHDTFTKWYNCLCILHCWWANQLSLLKNMILFSLNYYRITIIVKPNERLIATSIVNGWNLLFNFVPVSINLKKKKTRTKSCSKQKNLTAPYIKTDFAEISKYCADWVVALDYCADMALILSLPFGLIIGMFPFYV